MVSKRKKETVYSLAQVRVVPARLEHLAAMVACHKAAFPSEFTTLLGLRFLQGMYRFFIEQPEGICIVAFKYNTNCLNGVLIGGDPRLRRHYLSRNLVSLIITVFCKVVCDSHARKRFMKISYAHLQKLSRRICVTSCEINQAKQPDQPRGKWYLLQSVAVYPDFQRQGVGSALVEAFQLESTKQGCGITRLTVSSNNLSAIYLYKKLGWKNVGNDGILVYFHRSV